MIIDFEEIDKSFLLQPLSRESRLEIYKTIYLQGIDKGTHLERCSVKKTNSYKKNRHKKRFMDTISDINNYLLSGADAYKRKEYRVRHQKKKENENL